MFAESGALQAAEDSTAAVREEFTGNALAADLLSALLPLPAAGTLILRAAAGRLLLCVEQLPEFTSRYCNTP
jgi:hypothetical protein